MTGPRIGSLCSGYGGLDLGLMSVVGGSVAWHVEYDKAPAKILAHHWPDVPNYGDITTTDWTQVEPVDWLTAGYPCQPFSHAGKRKGTTDERHIWPFVAGAIGVLRPRHVLLENVRGHLTLGFDSVLADLARLGYDATWGLVRAADVGAPHSRARLFVVATDTRSAGAGRNSAGASRQEEPDRRREPCDTDAPGVHRLAPADSCGERHGRGQDGREVGRLDGGDESETRERERSRAVAGDRSATATADPASNGRHEGRPEPARLVGGSDAAERGDATTDTPRERRAGRLVPCPDVEYDGSQPAHAGPPRGAVEWGAYEPAIRRWAAVTGRPAPAPTEPGRTGQRLSPRFVEWMQGLSAGHVTDVDIPRNAQLKALGNGVVPAQAALALRTLLPLTEVAA